ncbi:MAG: hypothetical protein OSB68_07215 [Dehalococcoidia bacterium]|nr:hypothetical protein [Dehalococcoidia bacterium]
MSNVNEYRSLHKHSHWLLLTLLVGALSLAMACGTSDSDGAEDAAAPAAEEVDEALAEVSRILSPGLSLTFDDYVAGGWKKSKQFDTDTVPEATDIWYGFFNAKDIEVRFYDSHEIAKTYGFDNASEAIDQSFREGGQYGSSNRGAGSSAVTKYKAFVVVGNTVMLCEQSVESCIALADILGG